MTRKDVILNAIHNMSDKDLYKLYDECYSAFRGLRLEEHGPTICDTCRFYRDSCTIPDGVYCPDDAYATWLRQEVREGGKRN